MTVVPSRTTRQGGAVPAFQVDDHLAGAVCGHLWCSTSKGYLKKTGGETLHQFVWRTAGLPPCKMIDHKNRDKTDNRLCNLRAADSRLNGANAGPVRSKPSRLPLGVSKSNRGSWRARIKVNGKECYLGTFDTVAEASTAYQEMKALIIKHRAAKIAERVGEA